MLDTLNHYKMTGSINITWYRQRDLQKTSKEIKKITCSNVYIMTQDHFQTVA